jgi:hypothetical protein
MASNLPKKNRTDQSVADQKLIDGLTQHASIVPPVMIDGVAFSPKDLIGVLQRRIGASESATTARATWQSLVVADAAEHATTRTIVSGLRQAMMVAFSVQVDTLAAFGLSPRKVRVLTPDQKIAAVARAKATREARHTMGKRQKARITGANPTGASPEAPVAPASEPTASGSAGR